MTSTTDDMTAHEAQATEFRNRLTDILGENAALRLSSQIWRSAGVGAEGDIEYHFIAYNRKVATILDQLR